MIRAFVLDDEPLAVRRLVRLLEETGRVTLAGTSSDPVEALAVLREHPPDVLLLDIQMPGMSGFELLQQLDPQPLVIFTTAYDEYALRAFEVNSIDYLLKPVGERQLARALDKMERVAQPGAVGTPPDWKAVIDRLAGAMRERPEYPERIASRLGERTQLVELSGVTHFYAKDKLTYAATQTKDYVVDHSIAELEQKLDPRRFCRIHRSTILNLAWLREVDVWFGGRLRILLKDAKHTQLQVARERMGELKKRLGI